MTCNLRINFFSVKIYEFKFQRLSESIGIAFTLDLKDLKTLRKTCTELEKRGTEKGFIRHDIDYWQVRRGNFVCTPATSIIFI